MRTLNFKLTQQIRRVFTAKGYNVTLDSSSSSDYISIFKDENSPLRCVVRVSDHNSCTSRSGCAAIEFIAPELMDGNISMIGFDEDGDVVYNEFECPSSEECNALVLRAVVAEIEGTQEFFDMSRLS